ncbi:MAG: two-component sensor histidine kinase [Elainella sp. C42_A2020_010]|nr:two-component sensor histidine kinase [Elainella sp. C42_A2020_010]
MHQNQLFNWTRLKLAGWYSIVMGLILCLFGLAIYHVMARAHWYGLDQELEVVSGTLHDALEPNLAQPGVINPEVQALLPSLCLENPDLENVDCSTQTATERHILGVVQQEGYYLRFLNPAKGVVATIGYQPENLIAQRQQTWQTLEDAEGTRYQQVTLSLKTRDQQFWGYMEVGRSLKEFDDHLFTLKWLLLIGLPLTLSLVALASWWLAGLAMRPVYRSYDQIQQFTADAAHELRTPLAAIRATVESVLQSPNLSEAESRNTLQIVERQNNRLAQLVQDLLLLSRMDIQKTVPKRQPCCLNDLISDVVEEFAALAMAADVRLDAKINPSQILYVLGDEEQLYRLLANLVTNAIQYTPNNGFVVMTLERDDHHALVKVQDTGIGISAADQMRIFDRFYRVNYDRSRTTGGSGLGLAIAQAIVNAHQGNIQVQSEIGKGSSFTVRLPWLKGNKC